MRIGARVLKTGLAIALAIFLSMLLIPDNSPSLAAIAAITTTLPSVKKSYDNFTKRVVANIIGGIIAVCMSLLIGENPLTIGIAAIICITILDSLKLNDVINLAVITVVAVMASSSRNPIYLIALYRVLETIIGVTVSFLVNIFVYPPRYDQKFYEALTNFTNELLVLIRASLRKNLSFSIMHRDQVWAEKEYANIQTIFNLMRNEFIWSKSQRLVVARRLVVYRHMMQTLQATIALLGALHSYEHVYNAFSRELQDLIRERVELLMAAQEQILMKFSGRVSSEEVGYITVPDDYRQDYLKHFFDEAKLALEDHQAYGDISVNGVIHIMSTIYTYEEEINSLNNILTIYAGRYQEEIEDIDDVYQT
ncbi:FUSC family protein [Hutsoniella sourekii]|uniref:FUSC family protein n=1 Tax=Hutsoniella sourekii TaxID=87650 RepID=UPI0004854057|nr:aromatic acid exporter family protein [Hutsoniella sourekii]